MFEFNKLIKPVFLSILMGYSSLSLAVPVIAEQILPQSGGDSVAISGEWGFVGDLDGSGNIKGCQVYVYRYDYITNLWGDGAGNSGSPYTELRTQGSCQTAEYGGFGASVSTSHGLLAVGAPLAKSGGSTRYGKIFFYQYDAAQTGNGTGGWVQKTAIGFPPIADQQADAAFGAVVSVRYAAGKALLSVGAPLYDGANGTDTGKAFLYEWDEATDTITYVNAVEGEAADDQFGKAITSNGLHFLVGAPFHDSGSFTDNGAAYLYSYDVGNGSGNGTITLQQKIDANTPSIGTLGNHNLGISVSLSPGTGRVMLLGGDGGLFQGGVRQLKLVNGIYEYAYSLASTLGGDVSQDGNIAGFGYKDRSVQLYYDNQDLTGSEDWKFSRAETDYGRDISVSGTRVMVNGNTNNQAYAYYTSSCHNGGSLKANEWTMIGLQCDTSAASQENFGAPATIGEIFGPDLGTYDTNWVMYKQNGTDYEGHQNAYVKLAATDVLFQGQGYWIITDDVKITNGVPTVPDEEVSSKKWTIPAAIGDAATQTPVIADPLPPPSGNEGRVNPDVAAVYSFDLKSTWANKTTPVDDIRIMLSNPFPSSIIWGDAAIETVLGGVPPTTTYDVVSGDAASGFFQGDDTSAYVYKTGVGTQNGYDAIAATTPGFSQHIAPGEGYFVRFNSSLYSISGNAVGLNLLSALLK